MSERAPCPSCGFTQLCNCEPEIGEVDPSPLPEREIYADFGRALDDRGIEKPVTRHWESLSLPADNQLEKVTPSFSEKFLEKYGRFITPDEREFFDKEPRRYGFPVVSGPNHGQALADARRDMESVAGLNSVARGDTGPFIKNEAYNFPIMVGLEYARIPPPLSDDAFALPFAAKQFARNQHYTAKIAAYEKERQWLESERRRFEVPTLFMNAADYAALKAGFAEDNLADACNRLNETTARSREERLAQEREKMKAIVPDEFRKVGSRDWWDGKEEGVPAPGPFFTGDPQAIGQQIRCFSDQVPIIDHKYRSVIITNIMGKQLVEAPQSRAPAFVRHLGESPEQVAMLLAQMSAPPGACSCQRINGFLFACLACSKAGKS